MRVSSSAPVRPGFVGFWYIQVSQSMIVRWTRRQEIGQTKDFSPKGTTRHHDNTQDKITHKTRDDFSSRFSPEHGLEGICLTGHTQRKRWLSERTRRDLSIDTSLDVCTFPRWKLLGNCLEVAWKLLGNLPKRVCVVLRAIRYFMQHTRHRFWAPCIATEHMVIRAIF